MRVVTVPLGHRSYSILIGTGLLRRLGPECRKLGLGLRCAVISDRRVAKRYAAAAAASLRQAGFEPLLVTVPAGETAKSLESVQFCYDRLAAHRLERRSFIVALGGGVVGDLAGFVASIFLRGVAYVQVPTTLLAQVDSSVGGKTGVNLPAGKNLVGTFWQPRMVYTDIGALATLTERDRASGLAEVIKHALIADVELLDFLEANAAAVRDGEPEIIAELVARSVAVKARVVGSDERETTGARALLNFGHTVGHAIESASHKEPNPLRHGEAVALGMLAAARVHAAESGAATLEPRIRALLDAVGLPVDLDRRLSPGTLARVAVDKKRGGEHISFVVVDEPGRARLVPLTPARIHEILLGGKTE